MARRRALAGDRVHLVAAVGVDLEGLVAKRLALLQFCRDVRVAGR